jgi:single-strand DNA-binding protein
MAQDNTVTIVGNLTREPELRFTPTGQATATFGVAVNRRWQDRQTNEWKEQTSFFDVVTWGQLAENAATSLAKGARVVVTGRLDQRTWETQEGEKRSKVEITADEIAPSLRFATVQVTRNERRAPEPTNGEPQASYDPEYQRPAPEPASVGYGAGRGTDVSTAPDEEPF